MKNWYECSAEICKQYKISNQEIKRLHDSMHPEYFYCFDPSTGRYLRCGLQEDTNFFIPLADNNTISLINVERFVIFQKLHNKTNNDYYIMDYIFGRTDNPQGKLYEYKPKIEQTDPEMKKFVEMCFDPKSPMNERLKETLLQMLEEAKQ